MKIRINGETSDLNGGSNVLGLLLELKLNPKTTVVEKNGEIIGMEKYEKELVRENDSLELIRYVGGG